MNYYSRFLSELERDGRLYEDSVIKISRHDPKWTEDRVLEALDHLFYDAFLYISPERPHEMAGAVAFNPSQNVAKALLVYVSPELRKRGIASAMTAEFIIWVIKNKFERAQIGLGKSEEMTAVLNSVNRRKNELLGEHASRVTIDPATGRVVF